MKTGSLGLGCLVLALWLPRPCPGQPVFLTVPSTLVYPSYWHTLLGVHRGTPGLLRLFLGGKAAFNNPQGLACTRLLENGDENDQLTVMGVNSGQACLIYNPDLLSLRSYGSFGDSVGQFNRPMGIAMLPNGRVAVADTGNNRVVLLKIEQGNLTWQGEIGKEGSDAGQFESPGWVAFDSQGRLYVSDTGNNRIQVFSEAGNYLFDFGSDQQADNSLLQPQALAVEDDNMPYLCRPENALFVVDGHHGRIQKFDLKGNFLGQTSGGDLGRLVYFSSLALDCFGNLWVVDMTNDQIHKFDRQLSYLDSWGSTGDQDGQLRSPRGIAIYPHYGQVFVSEAHSAQYFWIGVDVKDVLLSRETDENGQGFLRMDFTLTDRARAQAWLEDDSGHEVKRLLPASLLAEGGNCLRWDGKTEQGTQATPGVYSLVIRAEPTYSSATFVAKQVRQRFRLK